MKVEFVFIAIITTIAILHGCSTHRAVEDNQKHAESLLGRVEYAPASIYIDEPQEALPPIPIDNGPAWLDQPATASFVNTPFSVVVNTVADRRYSNVFSSELNASHEVTLNAEGTVRDIIIAIENASNYVAVISDTGIRWGAYIVEVFHIDAFPGEYNYLVGKESGDSGQNTANGGAENGQTIGGLYDVDSKQYSNQKLKSSDMMASVEEALLWIVGDQGAVSVTQGAGMVMVKAPPDRMAQVRHYMNEMGRSTTQILLELKIVKIRRKRNSAWGFDWEILRDNASTLLTFDGQIPNINRYGGLPSVIGVTDLAGKTEGSTIFLKLLDGFADVSLVHDERILTTANRVTEIEIGGIRGFLSRSQIETVDGGGTIATGETSQVRDGYSLYALTKPVGFDHVLLQLSNRISDIIEITNFELFDTILQTPVIDDTRLNLTNKVRSGNTLIVASIKQREGFSEAESPFSTKYLPTYKGDEMQDTEVLVLVTPRIIDT